MKKLQKFNKNNEDFICQSNHPFSLSTLGTGRDRRKRPCPTGLGVSLTDAILMALEQNLDIRIDELTPQIRLEEVTGAKGEFDPNLNFSVFDESLERP